VRRDSCIDTGWPQPQAAAAARRGTGAPALRQTYRLAVVCHVADAREVEAQLARMFDEHGLALDSLQRDPTSLMFVRITALLASSIAERAALVQIVHRLATQPSIRRLQWETVPKRSAPLGPVG
jgi:hypothetical protein